MRFLILIIGLFSTAALATRFTGRSSKRQADTCPSPNQITQAINNYFSDIIGVNNFIDNGTAYDQTEVGIAFDFEADEPDQLETLQNVCNVPANDTTIYSSIINDTLSATQQVLGAIADIQDGVGIVPDLINSINQVRCCTILGNLNTIFGTAVRAAAIASAVQAVPRPQAFSGFTVGTPACPIL